MVSDRLNALHEQHTQALGEANRPKDRPWDEVLLWSALAAGATMLLILMFQWASMDGSTAVGALIFGSLALFGLTAYFVPTIVAVARGHHQAAPIIVVNVFLGWSVVGWVVALAMACSEVRRRQQVSA